jgi:alkaline phosphatase
MAQPTSPFSRRRFLQTASAAGLLAALPLRAGDAAPTAAARAPGAVRRARNVIFMVSDGMSAGAFTLGDLYRRHLTGKRSHWAARLETGGLHNGLMDTASANSLVTDSAAGSSSWGGGHRVPNGSLNVAADGTAFEPILSKARRAGKAIGLVTSARLTHATPAGFLANVDSRASEDVIAVQFLERGLDVGLAGGRKHFLPQLRADHRDLAREFAAAGHTIVQDRAALLAAPASAERLLGLFADDHLPYRLDHRSAPALTAAVPTLAEMTTAALERLNRRPAGFMLQVEGGRVDHAGHNNDAAALLLEQLDFDDAVAAVLLFQQANPDTLVVITTDHGNSNPGLVGDAHADTGLSQIAHFRASFEQMAKSLKADTTLAELHAILLAGTGLPLTIEEIAPVHAALGGKGTAPYMPDRTAAPTLAAVLENYLAIGWTGVAHTGDFVIFTAIGPGAEAFPPLVRNDAVHNHILSSLGIG